MVCTRTSGNGLGILLPCTGESESVIMIAVADRRDQWVGPSSRPERLRASLRLEKANPQRERNGALHGVHAAVRFKKHLTPPTLSETRFFANLRNQKCRFP